MGEAHDIAMKSEALRRLLGEKFGVRGSTLTRALARAGRRLPRRLHVKAALLIEAERLAAHPKLARQVDMATVERGYEEVVAHLKAIDVSDRRKGMVLGIAGAVAFNMLLLVGAFVLWLGWRGYV